MYKSYHQVVNFYRLAFRYTLNNFFGVASDFLFLLVKFRIFFAFLGGMGMAIIYGFKVNLSVAIVAMVNQTALTSSNEVSHPDDVSHLNYSSDDICKSPSSDLTSDRNVTNFNFFVKSFLKSNL